MKVTLITTILNEESSIKNFLSSVENLTKSPDEIIFVDGGSKDSTVKILKTFQKKSKLNVKIIQKKGNISMGRNTAVKNSSNNIILCTDADCLLDKNWVENISKPFNDKKIDVAAGYYRPLAESFFEKCLGIYTSVMSDKIDSKNFLPSSRSIAFKKDAWSKAGKYPEWLNRGEDLYFARKLKEKKLNFKFVKNAFVYWPQRKNFKEAFIQFYRYAQGDGQARYIRTSTPFLFARYIAGIILLLSAFRSNDSVFVLITFLLFGYVIWSIKKNYRYVRDKKAFIYLPLLQITSDIAVILGMSLGYIQGFGIKR